MQRACDGSASATGRQSPPPVLLCRVISPGRSSEALKPRRRRAASRAQASLRLVQGPDCRARDARAAAGLASSPADIEAVGRRPSGTLLIPGETLLQSLRGHKGKKARPNQRLFYFYIFQNYFLHKYIFSFIIYSFVPLPSGCGATGPLPPSCRAVGT